MRPKIKLIIFLLIGVFVAGELSSVVFNVDAVSAEKEEIKKNHFVPGEVIVKFNDANALRTSSVDKVGKKHGLKDKERVFKDVGESKKTRGLQTEDSAPFFSSVYKLTFGENVDTEKIVEEYEQKASVEYAHLNYRAVLHSQPDDEYFDKQWGLYNEEGADIDALSAWNVNKGSSEIVVAVVDTGIDYNHPDLAGNMWADESGNYGYDFAEDNDDPMDKHGHGTHVAGIVAAETNNQRGIAGTSWHSNLMAVKIFNDDGTGGTTTQIANGLKYAADSGAQIISNSWGFEEPMKEPPQVVKDAIDYATDEKGSLVVFAAGNNNSDDAYQPAAYEKTLAVAATNRDDKRANFSGPDASNYGDWVDISAPGKDIYSTVLNEGYGYKSGTSMSAPFVSGLAALIWSQDETRTNTDVESIIISSVDDIGDEDMGAGRINAYKALTILETRANFYEAENLEGVKIQLYSDSEHNNSVGEPLVTGETGEVFTYLEDDGYWYVATKEDYEDYEGDFTLSGETEDIVFTMKESNPRVETLAPEGVTYDTATLKGELIFLAEEDNVDLFFEYREGGGDWETTSRDENVGAIGEFEKEISGLEDGTEYEFRAVVEWDENGTLRENYGEEVHFETVSYPSVETKDAVDVDYTSATLKGKLTEIGLEEEEGVKVYFEYKKETETEWVSTDKKPRSVTGEFEKTISGLKENVEYEFRAVVEWDEGNRDSQGGGKTFVTEDYPEVETRKEESIGYDKATLRGELMSLGVEDSVDLFFEYREFEESEWISTTPDTKSETGFFDKNITDLTEETEYEFRAVVRWNEDEKGYGEAFLFETENHPVVETKEETGLRYDSVTLNGELTDIGIESDVEVFFRYKNNGDWIKTAREKLFEEGEFSKEIAGDLEPNTEYQYKAVVDWGGGESKGEIDTFITEIDPANLEFSSITTNPSENYVGRDITLEVDIKNESGSDGSYTAIFKVEEVEIDSKTLFINDEGTKNYSVTYNKNTSGKYNFSVKDSGLTGTFEIFDEPHVRNIETESFTYDSVNIYGDVDLGLEDSIEVSFEWRKEDDFWMEENKTDPTLFETEEVVEEVAEGLKAGGSYDLRAVTYWNEDEEERETRTEMESFTVPGYPEVETLSATNVTYNSASLRGEVLEMGINEKVDVFFEWRREGEETWKETAKKERDEIGKTGEELDELEESTTYEFKAVMEWEEDGKENDVGGIKKFTTTSQPSSGGGGGGGGGGTDNDDDEEEDDEEETKEKTEEGVKIESIPNIKEEVETLQRRKQRLTRIRNMAQTLLEHPDLEEGMKETLKNILQKSENLEERTREALEEKEGKLEKALERRKEKEELVLQKERAKRIKNMAQNLLEFAEEENVKEVLEEAVERAKRIRHKVEEEIENF